MNALDALLLLSFGYLLAMSFRSSASERASEAIGLLSGIVLGFLLSSLLASHFTTDLAKGVFSLTFIIVLCVGFSFAGMKLGARIKTKLLLTPQAKLDHRLAAPVTLLGFVLFGWLLADSLIYVPILNLQYEAQGSSVLITSQRLLPTSPTKSIAENIAPDQSKHLLLKYETAPVTDTNLRKAGELEPIAKRLAHSVVRVSGNFCAGIASGTGFAVAPGLIVTNAHVVIGGSSIYVRDHDQAYPATPLVIDRAHDIAVLHSEFINLPSLTFASNIAKGGDKSLTLGFPGAGDLQASIGKILDENRINFKQSSTLELDNSNTYGMVDSTIQPGSSGSPVFSTAGEVIAVVNAAGEGTVNAVRASEVLPAIEKAKHRFYSTGSGFCEDYNWNKVQTNR